MSLASTALSREHPRTFRLSAFLQIEAFKQQCLTQKLRCWVIVRDHFLEKQGQPADILRFDDAPKSCRRAPNLLWATSECNTKLLDLGVGCRDQAFIFQVQLFERAFRQDALPEN